jgi:hypothetical protein
VEEMSQHTVSKNKKGGKKIGWTLDSKIIYKFPFILVVTILDLRLTK